MMTAKMGERDSREEIMKAFKLFDDDNTGFITLKNLKRVAKELGENLTDEELMVRGEVGREGEGVGTASHGQGARGERRGEVGMRSASGTGHRAPCRAHGEAGGGGRRIWSVSAAPHGRGARTPERGCVCDRGWRGGGA